MIDWNIQARAMACQACSRPFADQQVYHTLLFDQKSGYQRLDVCGSCWTSQFSQGANDRKGFVSHWQGEFVAPPPIRPDPIQKETAETLLRKLVERNDSAFAAAGYILAVMLERKRVFKAKGQAEEEGRRVLIYEHARTGEAFTIRDPDLQLNQLETVQRLVAHLLDHGLPAAAADAPSGSSTPSTAAGAAQSGPSHGSVPTAAAGEPWAANPETA